MKKRNNPLYEDVNEGNESKSPNESAKVTTSTSDLSFKIDIFPPSLKFITANHDGRKLCVLVQA